MWICVNPWLEFGWMPYPQDAPDPIALRTSPSQFIPSLTLWVPIANGLPFSTMVAEFTNKPGIHLIINRIARLFHVKHTS